MFLIGQILIYFALALIVGGAIGFMLRACMADTACDDVRDALKEAQLRYQMSEENLASVRSRHFEPVAPLATANTTLAALNERDLEIALLAAAPGTSLLGRFGADDLTAIKGITPKIDVWLGLRGITRFSHIATLTPSELYWLIENLPHNGASVYRDHWVAQAVELDISKGKV
jgi:predicted flap endonuclease-1-like 5' DNA nuclease